MYAAPEGTSLAGAIVVIAGASNGIGLALAHQLAALDAATIVLGCRNLSKCEQVRPAGARCVQLDLADLRSVVQFAAEVALTLTLTLILTVTLTLILTSTLNLTPTLALAPQPWP